MADSMSPLQKKIWLKLKRSPLTDVTKYLMVVTVLIWILARGTEQLGYNWQWYQVPKYIYQFQDGEFSFGPLLFGLAVTFRITAWGLILSMAIGLV